MVGRVGPNNLKYHTAFIFRWSGLLGCLNLQEEGASVLWSIQNRSAKDTSSYHVTSYHIISYHITSYHILSHIISCNI